MTTKKVFVNGVLTPDTEKVVLTEVLGVSIVAIFQKFFFDLQAHQAAQGVTLGLTAEPPTLK